MEGQICCLTEFLTAKMVSTAEDSSGSKSEATEATAARLQQAEASIQHFPEAEREWTLPQGQSQRCSGCEERQAMWCYGAIEMASANRLSVQHVEHGSKGASRYLLIISDPVLPFPSDEVMGSKETR